MNTRKIKVSAKKAGEAMELFRALSDKPVNDHLTDDEITGYAQKDLSAEERQQVEDHLASCSYCTEEVKRLMTESAHHLTDDKAIGYALKYLSANERQQVKNHLISCSDCAKEVKRLEEGAAVWSGEQGAKRLANLRDIIRAKMPKKQTAVAGKSHAAVAGRSLTHLVTQLARFILPVGLPKPATLKVKNIVTSSDLQAEDDRFLRCRVIPDEQENLILRIASNELAEGTRLRLFVKDTQWQRFVTLSGVAPDQVGARLVITREERKWPADTMLEFGIPLEDLDQAPEQGER